jgi:hypothetical protein
MRENLKEFERKRLLGNPGIIPEVVWRGRKKQK